MHGLAAAICFARVAVAQDSNSSLVLLLVVLSAHELCTILVDHRGPGQGKKLACNTLSRSVIINDVGIKLIKISIYCVT